VWSSWPSTPPSHSTTAIHLSVAEPAVVRASAPPPRCSCNALQAAHFLSRRVGRPEQLANGAECDGATELGAGSPGGASSAPLASTAGTSTNRRLPLRPPCGEGVSACDAKGFAALPFGTDGRRTPGHAARREPSAVSRNPGAQICRCPGAARPGRRGWSAYGLRKTTRRS